MNQIDMRRQRGLTMIGMVLVVAVVLFFLILTVKLVPVYMTSMTMENIVESLKDEEDLTKKSPRDIMRLINNRMVINQVRAVTADNILIEKEGNSVVYITVDYEEVVPFAGNISILAQFHFEKEFVGN